MQSNLREQQHSSNTSGNTLSTGTNRLFLDHNHHSSLSTTEMDENPGINVPETGVNPRFLISTFDIRDLLYFFYKQKSMNPPFFLMTKALVIVVAFVAFYIMKNT